MLPSAGTTASFCFPGGTVDVTRSFWGLISERAFFCFWRTSFARLVWRLFCQTRAEHPYPMSVSVALLPVTFTSTLPVLAKLVHLPSCLSLRSLSHNIDDIAPKILFASARCSCLVHVHSNVGIATAEYTFNVMLNLTLLFLFRIKSI